MQKNIHLQAGGRSVRSNGNGTEEVNSGSRLSNLVHEVASSEKFAKRLRKRGQTAFEHVVEGAQSFVTACAVRYHISRSVWIVCPNVRRQEEIFNGLLNWQVEGLFFPQLEMPAIEGAVPDPEIVAERLDLLRKVSEGKRSVVVLCADSLNDLVPGPEALQSQTTTVKRNDRMDRESFLSRLIESGYEQVPQVTTRGQFAVRGGILDIFSWQHPLAARQPKNATMNSSPGGNTRSARSPGCTNFVSRAASARAASLSSP